MGLDVRDKSRVCRTPPGPLKIRLSTNTDHRGIVVAASLITILSMAALSTYLFWLPLDGGDNNYETFSFGHGVIEIDGDADFAATALLEGWPGNGTPENPYLIDGLDIDRGDAAGHCISILNTRVSFIMRNCRFTGANVIPWDCCPSGLMLDMLAESGAGILLDNVANGELVNNTCNSNNRMGIFLIFSHLNTVANNTCCSNTFGILLYNSTLNTVINNTCSNNEDSGIYLYESSSNTVVNNTCYGNGYDVGIYLHNSHSNNMTNNTCNDNDKGITFWDSPSNTVANNICNNNTVGVWVLRSNSNTVVNNTCNSNKAGIWLLCSDFNTMANNTCFFNYGGIASSGANSNTMANNMCNNNKIGISLNSELSSGVWIESRHNTVTNNICNQNEVGIGFKGSSYNTVENNICNENEVGIGLDRQMELTYWIDSHSNTVANNTCNYNRIGIYLRNSTSNTVVNNTFVGNTEYDILEESGTEESPPDIFSCSDSQELHFWVQDGNW